MTYNKQDEGTAAVKWRDSQWRWPARQTHFFKEEEALLTIEQRTPKLQETNDGLTLKAIKRWTGWLLILYLLCVQGYVYLLHVILKHAKYGINCHGIYAVAHLFIGAAY